MPWTQTEFDEHIIAAGYRVPYELLTGDLSQVNYSSLRGGLVEFRRMVDALQWQLVIPGFCESVWRWFQIFLKSWGRMGCRIDPESGGQSGMATAAHADKFTQSAQA